MSTACPIVVVRTNSAVMGAAIAAQVGAISRARVLVRPSSGGSYGISFSDDADGEWMAWLLGVLAPLSPPSLADCDVEDEHPGDRHPEAMAVLQLPDWPAGEKLPEVEGFANSEAARDAILGAFGQLPYRNLEVKASHVDECSGEIRHGTEVPAQFSEMAAFLLTRLGFRTKVIHPDPARERTYASQKITIRVPDLALVARHGQAAPYRVIVRCDQGDLAESIAGRLEKAGYPVLVGSLLRPSEITDQSIRLDAGPYSDSALEEALDRLKFEIQGACRDGGIDVGRYPVVCHRPENPSYQAYLEVPSRACLDGTARSTGGDHPDRFRVRIDTDDTSHPAIRDLAEGLVRAGFRAPAIRRVDSALVSDSRLLDFRLAMGALEGESSCRSAAFSLLQAARSSLDPGNLLGLAEEHCWDSDDPDVLFRVPVAGVADGSLAARLSRPEAYPVKLIAENPAAWDDLAASLEAAGFRIAERDATSTSGPKISYGAAPGEVLRKLEQIVRRHSGARPTKASDFHCLDTDIYLHLPAKPARRRKPRATGELPGTAVLSTSEEPFLSADPAGVSVAGVRLERRFSCEHPGMVPHQAGFAHFCIDQCAAETLGHLALSVRLGEPCLLEGETSTAKTSSIQYLASLLGQPVVRINLNGQSDTGELVGRFVPATGTRAAGGAQWTWQDGVLLEALRHGWWVILDELNLAEPAILERLNSLLERTPSLLITEHDNRVFGPSGEPIHPEFRIFGTMNPAEYAGRNVLSPAYRDRWRGHLIVRNPGEAEYRAMLRRMVFGEVPPVCVDGVVYGSGLATGADPTHGELADQPGIDHFLDGLARFQAGLEAGLREPGRPEQGSGRKEKPVFTRRGLIALLDHLASPAHAGRKLDSGRVRAEALRRYFLGRLSGEDARVARHLLQASGLDFQGAGL